MNLNLQANFTQILLSSLLSFSYVLFSSPKFHLSQQPSKEIYLLIWQLILKFDNLPAHQTDTASWQELYFPEKNLQKKAQLNKPTWVSMSQYLFWCFSLSLGGMDLKNVCTYQQNAEVKNSINLSTIRTVLAHCLIHSFFISAIFILWIIFWFDILIIP